jgi:lysophospholipase L1-like esterase
VRRLLVLLPLSFGILALASEAGLRLFHDPEYLRPPGPTDGTLWKNIVHRRSSVPGLDYELKPLVHRNVRGMDISTNSLGMRDREPLADRGPGDVRVVAVGDSLTFGMRVAADETWPEVLEAKLAAAPPSSILQGTRRVEVLNLGVSGYGTLDEAIVVREKAMPLRPDLVIVGYYLNDPEIEPVQQLHQHFRVPLWWEHSSLLRFLRCEKRKLDQDRLGCGDPFWYLHQDPESWRSVVDGFAAIAAAARNGGARVLLVVLPTLRGVERWEDYAYRELHDRVVEAGSAAGFETLDVLPAWVASGHAPGDLAVDGEHPNAVGQGLIGAAVFAKIASMPSLLRDRRVAVLTGSGSTRRRG